MSHLSNVTETRAENVKFIQQMKQTSANTIKLSQTAKYVKET